LQPDSRTQKDSRKAEPDTLASQQLTVPRHWNAAGNVAFDKLSLCMGTTDPAQAGPRTCCQPGNSGCIEVSSIFLNFFLVMYTVLVVK
jgi:hypothetical protein